MIAFSHRQQRVQSGPLQVWHRACSQLRDSNETHPFVCALPGPSSGRHHTLSHNKQPSGVRCFACWLGGACFCFSSPELPLIIAVHSSFRALFLSLLCTGFFQCARHAGARRLRAHRASLTNVCMHQFTLTQAAHALGVRNMMVQGDSELIVRQIKGQYKASEKGGLSGLRDEAKMRLAKFKRCDVKHVYRWVKM